jgi:hypothetical protein
MGLAAKKVSNDFSMSARVMLLWVEAAGMLQADVFPPNMHIHFTLELLFFT